MLYNRKFLCNHSFFSSHHAVTRTAKPFCMGLELGTAFSPTIASDSFLPTAFCYNCASILQIFSPFSFHETE